MKFVSGLANSDHFTEETFGRLRDLLALDGMQGDRLTFDLSASGLGALRASDLSSHDAREMADDFRNCPLVLTFCGNDFRELIDEVVKIAARASCEVQAYLNGMGITITPDDTRSGVARRYVQWMEIDQSQLTDGRIDFGEHRSLLWEAGLSVLAAAQLLERPIDVRLKGETVRVLPEWKLRDLVKLVAERDAPVLRGLVAAVGESYDEA